MLEGQPRRLAVPRVRVPASTSNLGPGFDLLGLALSLELDVTARPDRGAGDRVVPGADLDWPSGDDDLLLRALRAGREQFGVEPEPCELSVASEIPHGRGLGSSGAAIVAGLLIAAALAERTIERAEVCRLAIELEGHPDNVTPSLYGGCRLSLPREDGPPLVVAQDVHPSLAFAAAWPRTRIPTQEARSLLPPKVPFEDATWNPRALAMLLEGLRTGDPTLLAVGLEDRLHERYRLARIPGGDAAIDAARKVGAIGAVVSGSGTAVVAITSEELAGRAAEAMAAAFRAADGEGTGSVLEVVERAPVPEEADQELA